MIVLKGMSLALSCRMTRLAKQSTCQPFTWMGCGVDGHDDSREGVGESVMLSGRAKASAWSSKAGRGVMARPLLDTRSHHVDASGRMKQGVTQGIESS